MFAYGAQDGEDLALGGKMMAPKNPKDKEQTGRVGEAVYSLSLIEHCRGRGRASTTRSEASVRAAGPDQVEPIPGHEVA